jgi:hypothetical protein
MNERKQSKNRKNIKNFNDDHAYNQPERYERSPQYGRQINVEQRYELSYSSIFESFSAKTR